MYTHKNGKIYKVTTTKIIVITFKAMQTFWIKNDAQVDYTLLAIF